MNKFKSEQKTIDELYFGNINPSSKSVIKNSEYDKLANQMVDLIDKLESKLNKEEHKILFKICDVMMEKESIWAKDMFVDGFILGTKLTYESLTYESDNFKEL